MVASQAETWERLRLEEATLQFVLRRFGHLKAKSQRVATDRIPVADGIGNVVGEYFPTLGAGHTLCDGVPLHIHLQEPQASRGIAHYCEVDLPARTSAKRCKSAVRALLPNEPEDSAFLASLDRDGVCQFRVDDEVGVDNSGNRMDWVICWESADGEPFRLVVEMKFDHATTAAQLNSYGRDAQSKITDQSNYRLVFLTVEGYFPRTRRPLEQTWYPVSWFNFLRRWECWLHRENADDAEFKLFRRQLWVRIGV